MQSQPTAQQSNKVRHIFEWLPNKLFANLLHFISDMIVNQLHYSNIQVAITVRTTNQSRKPSKNLYTIPIAVLKLQLHTSIGNKTQREPI